MVDALLRFVLYSCFHVLSCWFFFCLSKAFSVCLSQALCGFLSFSFSISSIFLFLFLHPSSLLLAFCLEQSCMKVQLLFGHSSQLSKKIYGDSALRHLHPVKVWVIILIGRGGTIQTIFYLQVCLFIKNSKFEHTLCRW